MSDKMREAFEYFYSLDWDDCDVFMQKQWEAAWKASRAVLVVDLEGAHRSMACAPIGGTMWSEEVYNAIHAAGVKTK